jgi:hypothetical protein
MEGNGEPRPRRERAKYSSAVAITVDGFAVEMLSLPIDSQLYFNVFSKHGGDNIRYSFP